MQNAQILAHPAANGFRALRAQRARLIAQDEAAGPSPKGDAAKALAAVLEALEQVEMSIISTEAETAAHASEKLSIIGRAIASGADADHVLTLFSLAREDLERFRAITMQEGWSRPGTRLALCRASSPISSILRPFHPCCRHHK